MEQHWRQIQMYHIEQPQHIMDKHQQDHQQLRILIHLIDGHQQ